jgi:hypothetical protein
VTIRKGSSKPLRETAEAREARRRRKASRLQAGTVRGASRVHATGAKAERKRRDGERQMRNDHENGDRDA